MLAYALLAKGIPALYSDYGRLARLRSPIGYWNALSLLGDMALVLGLWRGARKHVDGVLLVFVATVATLLAYSRGGVLIGVLVAAAWLALTSDRFEALVTLALGGGAGVGVAGVSLLLHGVTHNHQSHASRAHDGLLFLLLVVVLGVVAAMLARRAFRLEPTPAAQQRATFALLALLVLGAVGGIVGVALQSGHSTSASPAGSHCVQGARRFACGSSDERLDWWKEAWQSFRDQPLHGTGAGSFQLAHTLRRTHFTRPVPEPHNLALQVLGETGIVGFVLLAGAVVAAAFAIRPRVREDDAAAALAICVVAYLLHALIDIDYDFVAVSAPFFVVLGVLLARPGPVLARREPIWALGIAAFAATAILSLAAPYIAQQKTNDALHATSNSRALGASPSGPHVEPRLRRPAVGAGVTGAEQAARAAALPHGRRHAARQSRAVDPARPLRAARPEGRMQRVPRPQPRVHARPLQPGDREEGRPAGRRPREGEQRRLRDVTVDSGHLLHPG